MRCAKCGAENLEDAKFCKGYASPILVKCPRCRAGSQPGSRFCDECAAPPTAPSPGSDDRPAVSPSVRVLTEAAAATPADCERKTVAALFAGIKGSMDLIEDLDPEEARAIVDPAPNLMMKAGQRYGGYVACCVIACLLTRSFRARGEDQDVPGDGDFSICGL
ncbi:MAG: zinc ribbon domain-containing protein [Deltaproteobacteria bacterium]|jgi:hypothetical protein|nr:zinc ribbon domain-containing protein [Deltaproteobacteria bacterium]